MTLVNLSIIIPCRDSKSTLPLLLESLKDQLETGDELIVVDDDDDHSPGKIAKNYNGAVVSTGGGKGPAFARNLGAKKGKGEVLLFLDSDVIAQPNLVEHVRKRFADNKNLEALSGIYNKEPANSKFFHHIKAAQCSAWFQGQKEFESLETACCAILKTRFFEVGGFNEKFKGADVEDYEFGYRLGRPVELDKKMMVKHHFPDFWKNTKNYFKRSYQWAKIFHRRKRFDAAATTAKGAFSAFLAPLFIFSAIAAPIVRGFFESTALFWLFISMAGAFIFLWMMTKHKILSIMNKKFGIIKSFLALPYIFIGDIAAFTGGVFGVIMSFASNKLNSRANK